MRVSIVSLVAVVALLPASVSAQVNYTENFTGTTTTNTWYFFGGACLTAGSNTSLTIPGYVPSCATLALSGNYYNTYIPAASSATGNAFNTTDEPLIGGNTGTLPDSPSVGGALRLTNGTSAGSYPDGLFEIGGIVSNFTFPLQGQGLKVAFTTETYDIGHGSGFDPYKAKNYDGADGISFFLQDATQSPDLGGLGGSLSYSCSDSNLDSSTRVDGTGKPYGPALTQGYSRGYDGLNGGFLGVGIDEYGNFLNGSIITAADGTQSYQGSASYNANGPNGYDNTSSGIGYSPGTVGIRGPGSTAFYSLNHAYSQYYPATMPNNQRYYAVYQACISGIVWDYSNVSTSLTAPNGNTTINPANSLNQPIPNGYGAVPVTPVIKLPNYAPIAYRVLSGVQIANQNATVRGTVTPVTASNAGVPITYNLMITPAGLLSMSYSYNGGAFQPVITGQNILSTTATGSLPTNVRFGFAGSEGGPPNTHEIMCFQAVPAVTANSSAGVNLKQTAQLETGSQVYFAKYDPTTWAGSLTSQNLNTSSTGVVSISSTINWDASCVLTGGACATTGAASGSAQGIDNPSRTILSWNGSTGIPFTFTSLSSAEQAAINAGDVGATSTTQTYRLEYLRGNRSNEQNSQGQGLYRTRASVLGDIIDSGPTWVGAPSQSYPLVWKDYLYFTQTNPENSGQNYTAFIAAEQARINVVYTGANDGLLHGFRTGSYPTTTSYDATTNDGKEVLAYMPAYVVNTIQSTSNADDYSSPQYGHHFDVDQSPGTGDLFYGGKWHTWLVGGLGAGGSAIYALDITDSQNFSESNAGNVVIGEWSYSSATGSANFLCAAVTANASTSPGNCGNNLGNTYGIPQIRRFHNGQWGVVFGNGFGSASGDAGIYIMMVDPSSGARTIYYLSTGTSGTSNGIAYTTPADLDGDHIVDYIYAGDLKGNVWRFDVTGLSAQVWSVQSSPIFTTASNQPITSKLVVAAVPSTPNTRVLVEFGTGQLTQFTNSSASSYVTNQQYLYGVWDYNLASFDAFNSVQFGYLPGNGFTAPSALSGTSQLQQQTITSYSSTTDYRTVSSNPICWADTAACSGNQQYGWYLKLPYGYASSSDPNLPTAGVVTTQASPVVYEQVIYNPVLADGAFIVNTTIPSTNSLSSCLQTATGGWTMAINPATGGAFTKTFFNTSTTNTTQQQLINGLALSGTGSVSLITSTTGTYLVTQTTAGTGTVVQVTPPAGTSGSRLTWTQKR
jgi:type IV pilus assembly protein PilY1